MTSMAMYFPTGSDGEGVCVLRPTIRTVPPSGIAWMALINKLLTTWDIWPASMSTTHRSAGNSMSQRTLEPLMTNEAESRITSEIEPPYFSTKQEGRGLGLASAYSIAKQHEGLLTVESQPGEGGSLE